jgi:hypothetical protein
MVGRGAMGNRDLTRRGARRRLPPPRALVWRHLDMIGRIPRTALVQMKSTWAGGARPTRFLAGSSSPDIEA